MRSSPRLRAPSTSTIRTGCFSPRPTNGRRMCVAYFGDGRRMPHGVPLPADAAHVHGDRARRTAPIIEILEQTPAIPEACQWALFLRNHDELTLEMVTDDERDYMYQEYAKDPRMRLNLGIRRRLAPLMDNGRRRMELLYGLLFSLPGSPVLYYGDEIGMGTTSTWATGTACGPPCSGRATATPASRVRDPSHLFQPLIGSHLSLPGDQRGVAASLSHVAAQLAAADDSAVRKKYPIFSRGALQFIPSPIPPSWHTFGNSASSSS